MHSLRIFWALIGGLLLSVLPTAGAIADTDVGDQGGGSFVGTHIYTNQGSGGSHGGTSTPVRVTVSKATVETVVDFVRWLCRFTDPYADCYPDDGTMTLVLDQAIAERAARELLVQLQLPTPTPMVGPDPDDNEWGMAAVGYPLWLWTPDTTTVTSRTSGAGLTFTLTARYRSTTFAMGDGHTLTCTATTRYRGSVEPGTASPTCGYRHARPSPQGRPYTVTATTHWVVSWSVAGFSGTLPGTHTAQRTLEVGELQAIVNR